MGVCWQVIQGGTEMNRQTGADNKSSRYTGLCNENDNDENN